MNSETPKFRQRQTEIERQEQSQSHSSEAQPGMKFDSVEDLLRHDSTQNPVSPEVAIRLNNSLAAEPKPTASWWRKLFSGK